MMLNTYNILLKVLYHLGFIFYFFNNVNILIVFTSYNNKLCLKSFWYFQLFHAMEVWFLGQLGSNILKKTRRDKILPKLETI